MTYEERVAAGWTAEPCCEWCDEDCLRDAPDDHAWARAESAEMTAEPEPEPEPGLDEPAADPAAPEMSMAELEAALDLVLEGFKEDPEDQANPNLRPIVIRPRIAPPEPPPLPKRNTAAARGYEQELETLAALNSLKALRRDTLPYYGPQEARRKLIIRARYAGATLREIGDAIGLTEERVRQIMRQPQPTKKKPAPRRRKET